MNPPAGLPLRLIVLGDFLGRLPVTLPRPASPEIAPLRLASVAQLPERLERSDLLLTELAWLSGLPEAEREMLARRASSAAGWIALTDERARFKEQVTWQRLGVAHFFRSPLDPERLAALVDGIRDRLAGEPVRAILLDDDESSLDYYGEVLRRAGIRVLATQDPLLVLESLDEHRPDVLVLDIEMPGCRGTELLAIVRQHPAWARLPAIFLTAMDSMQDRLLARAAGAEDFLVKPVAPGLLQMSALSHARRHRALLREESLVQRQRAQSRLRLEQLRQAIDEHAIVSIADADGNIVHVNDRFCAISGYDRHELIGRNHRLIKSGRHPAAFYGELWSTITGRRVWHGEVCNRRKSGELYWVEATICPILDGRGIPVQYISIRTDITALKQKARLLRESNERLNFAVEGAGDGIWDWDMASGTMSLSGNYEGMLGHARGEIEPTIAAWRDSVHPDDRASVRERLQNYLDGQVPSYAVELRLRCKDGTYKWVLCRGTVAQRDAAGMPLRMIGIHSDISQRKAAELALIEAREAADHANQAKSDFLSSMSHELRTPMNAIIGFAQMLEYDDITADQQDSVHEILKAAHHLLELINEVLDLARIESGRIDLSMEGVDIAALGEDCRQLIQPIADRAGIRLEIDLPAGQAMFADRVRLKQVLLNLLSNAVKYNRPAGHVRLHAGEGRPGRLRLVVADSGPGIAPARLGELFQPFNRLGAEASEIEGTGIGLTITRRLVDMMGGEVGVDSTPGVGSTFWVELPAAGQAATVALPAAPAGLPDAAAEPAPRQSVVLAVDDNPTNLKLIAQVVGMREHIRLLTAHTPELGIELALAHRPDLILLDINMPGLDGYQVLAVLKAAPSLRAIPVVAVTASAMPRDIERGLAAGFADYQTKPLDIELFLRMLDRQLQDADMIRSTDARRAIVARKDCR